ncbi:S8 family peptidase [Shimia sp. R9_3]|uniref:S8 family peptidase n=1 Tax=Shimia sp. R9_3 TaxID=2821113 RepID=UPI001ADCC900|nr:S8 family serine peptidase [Shimia sp. R9_3]
MKISTSKLIAFALLPALVAGCGGGEDDSSSTSGGGSAGSGASLPFTNNPTLLASFIDNLDAVRGTANRLLTRDARYRLQNAPAGVYVDRNGNNRLDAGIDVELKGNPIETAGIHYAHAAGLTGAGQIIAFSDNGFLTSHEAFSGKSITTGSSLSVDDHGTFVASVATGNSSDMIGVAPEADVIFGSFDTFEQLTETANAARSAGAVALNNSWGFASRRASLSNYNSLVSTSAGSDYVDALSRYAQDGIVLFSISNDSTISNVGLLPGLPIFEPSLQGSWIAVVNGVPVLNGDDIVAAERVSGACLEAAAWCISANGSWTGANASSTSSYGFGTGTSFAAPTVAGALALLAEAFPTMTNKELRVRLLATADNEFDGFSQDGTVELVPGFEHAYSSEWGHGFLNVGAALLPIGQSTVTTGNGTVLKMDKPLVVAGGASGDAVSRALRNVDLVSRDALSANFVVNAAQFVAERQSAPLFSLADIAAFDRIEMRQSGGAAFFGDRRSILLFTNNTDLDIRLFQSTGDGQDNMGFGVTRGFDLGLASLHVSATYGDDTATLLSDWNGGTNSSIFAVDMALSADITEAAQLSFEFGYALGEENSGLGQAADVLMNAGALRLSHHGVWAHNDRLSVAVSLPAAISSGSTSVALPVLSANGVATTRSVAINLAPEEREMRIALNYVRPLTDHTNFGVSLAHAQNRGNIAGERETAILFGFRTRF